ncbi:MAG: phage tail tape measure protein [Pseudomonadota bacterium]
MANSLNYMIVVGAKDKAASSTLKKISGGAKNLAKNAAAVTGALVAAGGAALSFAARQATAIDAMAKTARAAGVSAETLQELRFAAERTGAGADVLDAGLGRATKRIGEAAAGGGAAKTTLDRLGISVFDLAGNVRGTEDVLGEFIEKTSQMETQQEKAAAASALFGVTAGTRLALLLNEGTEGVAALRTEARQLGIVSNQNAAQAERTADAMINFKQSTNALGQALAVRLFPALETVARFLTAVIPRGLDLANAGILKMRQIWLSVMAGIIGKVRDVVGVLAEVERAAARTQIALGRDFNQVETPLADLEQKLTGVHEIVADMADTTDQEFSEAMARATGKTEDFATQLPETERAVVDFGDSTETAGGQVSGLTRELTEVEQMFPAVQRRLIPTTSEVEAFWKEIEAANDSVRTVIGPGGIPGLSNALETASRVTGEAAEKADELTSTTSSIQDWATAISQAFGGIEGDAGRAISAIGGLIGTFNELNAVRDRQGGTLTSGQTALFGAQIGGFVGGIGGFGRSGQVASTIGGLLGSFLPGGPVTAAAAAAGLGALFDDFGESNTRIQLRFGQARTAAEGGADPRFFRRAGGLAISGEAITEITDGLAIINDVATLIEGLGDIGRLSNLGSSESIANALGANAAGGSVLGPFVNASREEILGAVLGQALGGFDSRVQGLVGGVTTVEDTLKRLELAIQLIQQLDESPVDQFAEAMRVASLTQVEALQEQSDALSESVRSYDGSTAALERITTGTAAFNQAIVQTLFSLEQASQQVQAITQGTLENLEFQLLGEQGGASAQLDFLLGRARGLTGEISGLDSADAITQQIQLINNLISQAAGLVPEGGLAGFIDDVRPILEQAEQDAQTRLEQIRQDVEALADATANAVRDAIAEPASQMQAGAQALQSGSERIALAAQSIEGSSQNFIVATAQIPTVIQVELVTTEVNAA